MVGEMGSKDERQQGRGLAGVRDRRDEGLQG